MLVRQKVPLKIKRNFTLKEALAVIMVIHLVGIGAIWYLPIAINKIKLMSFSSSKNYNYYQPKAPYSDALERAIITLQEWNKKDKQTNSLNEDIKKENKYKQAKH